MSSAQVGSYPRYVHLYCHKLWSSPELAPQRDPAPISAPQPRRPIHLPKLCVLSSPWRAKCPRDQASEVAELVAPPTMTPRPSLVSIDPTTLYPLHVLSTLEPTQEPESSHGGAFYFSPASIAASSRRWRTTPSVELDLRRYHVFMLNLQPKRIAARKKVLPSASMLNDHSANIS